ncbi:type II secretion system F family protein [Bordetella genomosp. 4]|uniref:Pilus assembly protein n=1 Tax=Bordetella genomosp. 4 TaxID=463044 RepID=A0A261U6Y7_9BORD|nr:type II secretion system F family protein [Bordetella genomosp. 4]OZI57694.1 pilus assembly protein [Bordetella genomosp. 4]
MVWIALTMSTACAVLLVWQMQTWFGPAVIRYHTLYTRDTSIKLGELFLFITPAQLRVWTMTLAIMIGGLAFILTGAPIVAGIAIVIATRLPQSLASRLRGRRLARFERQLPSALLALASALRAGVGVPAALRHIADHSEAPLAQEFGLLLREQRLGVSFETALTNLHARMPSEASALFVASLNVASHTGGNLAEILEGIAATLRERLKWQEKVRTLTSQGRLQAWIVGALPLLLLCVLSYLEADAMAMLWQTPTGWAVLAVLCMLEAGGMLLIRRIVNIDM